MWRTPERAETVIFESFSQLPEMGSPLKWVAPKMWKNNCDFDDVPSMPHVPTSSTELPRKYVSRASNMNSLRLAIKTGALRPFCH